MGILSINLYIARGSILLYLYLYQAICYWSNQIFTFGEFYFVLRIVMVKLKFRTVFFFLGGGGEGEEYFWSMQVA